MDVSILMGIVMSEEHSYYSLKVPIKFLWLKWNNLDHQIDYPIFMNPLSDAVYKRVLNTERPIACLLSGGSR